MANLITNDNSKSFETIQQELEKDWAQWQQKVSEGKAGVVVDGTSWFMKTGQNFQYASPEEYEAQTRDTARVSD